MSDQMELPGTVIGPVPDDVGQSSGRDIDVFPPIVAELHDGIATGCESAPEAKIKSRDGAIRNDVDARSTKVVVRFVGEFELQQFVSSSDESQVDPDQPFPTGGIVLQLAGQKSRNDNDIGREYGERETRPREPGLFGGIGDREQVPCDNLFGNGGVRFRFQVPAKVRISQRLFEAPSTETLNNPFLALFVGGCKRHWQPQVHGWSDSAIHLTKRNWRSGQGKVGKLETIDLRSSRNEIQGVAQELLVAVFQV